MIIVNRFAGAMLALAFLLLSVSANHAVAKAPNLSLPLDCVAQKTCFIQNYVDLDPSKYVRDYTCHKASYDGHKGVDFRILSIVAMKKGVRVLAAAGGVIKGVRDGMEDRLFGGKRASGVKGRECGNGLVIDHGEGWETQYCHMRKGSLTIKKGDLVKRGQKLGLVGLSGKTAFPHIHLSLRYRGRIVDPFGGEKPSNTACKTKTNASLWQQKVLKQFPYVSGQPFLWGFTDRPVKKGTLMTRGGVPVPASTKAAAMVFFGLALNLQKGDQLRISLRGPKGVIAGTVSKPMNRHKASYLLFAGKKRLSFSWPRGTYKGVFSLERNGKQVWEKVEILEF